MISLEDMAALAKLGLNAEQVDGVIAIMKRVVAPLEQRRASDRARKAKSREGNVTETGHGRDENGTGAEIPSKVSPQVSPQEIYNQPPILTPSVDRSARGENYEKKTVLTELSAVVGGEIAAEVIDHRKRLRKPMTVNSAGRLAGKLAACSDSQAAARMMIDRGWLRIEPEWFANARAGPAAAPPNVAQFQPRAQPNVSAPPSTRDAFAAIRQRIGANNDDQAGNRELHSGGSPEPGGTIVGLLSQSGYR